VIAAATAWAVQIPSRPLETQPSTSARRAAWAGFPALRIPALLIAIATPSLHIWWLNAPDWGGSSPTCRLRVEITSLKPPGR
jgi:hypothetical protein